MHLSYLKRPFWVAFFIGVFLTYSLFPFWVSALFFLAAAAAFVLFRKGSPLDIKEESAFKKGMVFSPVNGKVIQVRNGVHHQVFGEDLIEIRICVHFFRRYGINVPKTCEVLDLFYQQGKRFWRFKGKVSSEFDFSALGGLFLKLETRAEDVIGLQFLPCHLGALPRLPLHTGDRGTRQAEMGILPLGGTVLLYLPKTYDILTRSQDLLTGGESIIAGETSLQTHEEHTTGGQDVGAS